MQQVKNAGQWLLRGTPSAASPAQQLHWGNFPTTEGITGWASENLHGQGKGGSGMGGGFPCARGITSFFAAKLQSLGLNISSVCAYHIYVFHHMKGKTQCQKSLIYTIIYIQLFLGENNELLFFLLLYPSYLSYGEHV